MVPPAKVQQRRWVVIWNSDTLCAWKSSDSMYMKNAWWLLHDVLQSCNRRCLALLVTQLKKHDQSLEFSSYFCILTWNKTEKSMHCLIISQANYDSDRWSCHFTQIFHGCMVVIGMCEHHLSLWSHVATSFHDLLVIAPFLSWWLAPDQEMAHLKPNYDQLPYLNFLWFA